MDEGGNCPCLEADPDIAGIGATISFIASTGLTLMCSGAALVFNLSGTSNVVDVLMVRCLEAGIVFAMCTLAGMTDATAHEKFNQMRAQFTPVFFAVVFSLADTQLFTGLAVLISGWARLNSGLSTYHFSIVTELAWLASDTQLLAFFTLFQCIRARSVDSNRSNQELDIEPYVYLPSRLVRALGMLCMGIMLFVATTMQSHWAWWDCVAAPAAYFLNHLDPGGSQLGWAIWNYIALLWGYGAALVPLFSHTYRPWVCIKTKVARTILLSGRSFSSTTRWLLLATGQFLDSITFDLMFASVWFGVGVWSIIVDRSQVSDDVVFCGGDTEGEWGFGQIVPMILLVLPMLAALDAYGKYSSAELSHLQP